MVTSTKNVRRARDDVSLEQRQFALANWRVEGAASEREARSNLPSHGLVDA